jgi:hypothetical protein
MKLRYAVFIILLCCINCPTKYRPSVKKVEVTYVSSLLDDIRQDQPLLSGIKEVSGIKIGHLRTDPPIIAAFLTHIGFFEVLEKTGIDYVIADTTLTGSDIIDYFIIPYPMGYAIENYEGIRFAIFMKSKDTLSIDDEVKLAIVKQRSDILWLIDDHFLDSPARHLDFYIENRALADTSVAGINITPDSTIEKDIRTVNDQLTNILNTYVHLDNQKIDEYILRQCATATNVNLVLYPADLFNSPALFDSLTVGELIARVEYHMRFKKKHLSKGKVLELTSSQSYQIWGELEESNQVLVPEPQGISLYELCFPKQVLSQ